MILIDRSVVETELSICEVRMLKSHSCCDSSRGLILKHFAQQIHALVIDLIGRYNVAQIVLREVGPLDRVKLLVLGQAGPRLLSRTAKQSKDLL